MSFLALYSLYVRRKVKVFIIIFIYFPIFYFHNVVVKYILVQLIEIKFGTGVLDDMNAFKNIQIYIYLFI